MITFADAPHISVCCFGEAALRVVLTSRLDMEDALTVARRVLKALEERNVEVFVEERVAKSLDAGRTCKLESADADFAIVVGGDGTVLRVVGKLRKQVPIVGVRMGRLGFIASVDPKNVEATIERLVRGEYFLEKVDRIEAKMDKRTVAEALNDVVVKSKAPEKMVRVRVTEKGGEQLIDGFMDGVIVATSIGATGYALSAGGPVVDPRLSVFEVVPLSPMRISTRPVILPSTVKLAIEVAGAVDVVVDGRTLASFEDCTVEVERSEEPAIFVRFERDFYRRVKERQMRDL